MKTKTEAILGGRLRKARLMRGYSLRGLAEALGGRVSHAALQKYEKGRMMPDSGLLLALADLFDLRPDYFFQQNTVALSGIKFRKHVKFGKKDQDRVLEEAREFFERYLEVESVLGIQTVALPRADLSGTLASQLGEEAEKAAEKARKEWKLGQGPLPNAQEMLEDHGVKVKEVEAADSFDGFSGWADEAPVIVLAKWLNADLPRKRLTELHELGHLVMRLPKGMDKKAEETVCYRFAGAMLIPRATFIEEFGRKRQVGRISLQELIAFKEQWGISIVAIMKRAEQLGLITADSYKRFCIYSKQHGWHKEEPGQWIGAEISSRFVQLVHRAAAQELITRSKAAGLLGVTLREFDRQFGKVEQAHV
ncbi:MAG: XRE family transcriptional regulator [Candidatus Sumerlaeota bacterium]|nr:XRE family transcriptional regulator [Candidatus Sumerlaeota bacterium]